ncbi:MAG TPA: MYXO-CTERM sorting domain-containing protein [Polyangia bacterium]|nr:MYXO-CTERM sorting domain-containing protein [Polyangia bacterium]
MLGGLLGDTYKVNNDGVNNGTVAAGTAKSASSLMGPPDIVIIGPFAEHDYSATLTEATWQADYKKLVDAYLALTPVPTVYVMTPPPAAFVYQSAAEQTFATGVVRPAVLAVAAGDNTPAKTLKVIDLFSDATLVAAADDAGDGHFTAAGMAEVAQLAYKCVAMGVCAGDTTTGAAGAGGGSAGASGAAGASGTAGAGGAGGVAGTAGTTGAGTAGAGGSTAGTAGETGGTAGAGAGGSTTGTAGGPTGGDTAGTTGTAGATTGAAGDTGTAGAGSTGAAGASGATRSSGGGCAVSGRSTTGAIASLLVAMALAVPAWRRRRRAR